MQDIWNVKMADVYSSYVSVIYMWMALWFTFRIWNSAQTADLDAFVNLAQLLTTRLSYLWYQAGLLLVMQGLFIFCQPIAGLLGTGFYLGRIEFLHVERPYKSKGSMEKIIFIIQPDHVITSWSKAIPYVNKHFIFWQENNFGNLRVFWSFECILIVFTRFS